MRVNLNLYKRKIFDKTIEWKNNYKMLKEKKGEVCRKKKKTYKKFNNIYLHTYENINKKGKERKDTL